MSSMAALITTAQEMREYQAAQEAARQEELKRVAAASEAAALADLKALLGDLADEAEITLRASRTGSNGEVYGTDYDIRPVAWHGVVAFSARRWVSDDPWRFEYYTVSGASRQLEFGHAPGNVWTRPEVLAMLADLQAVYEKARDGRIAVMLEWLGGNVGTLVADDAREILMTLAPERATEWDAALTEWQQRRDERTAAVDAYIQALAKWRAKYERVLADNRATVAGAQRALGKEFTVYEVGIATFYVNEDLDMFPHRESVWTLEDESDVDGYWRVLVDGRVERRRLYNALWMGEAVTRKLSEAGPGPWRRACYVHDAGESVYFLPWDEWEKSRQLDKTITPLPAEPTPPEFFSDGLTVAECERINEVTRGMARVEIPF